MPLLKPLVVGLAVALVGIAPANAAMATPIALYEKLPADISDEAGLLGLYARNRSEGVANHVTEDLLVAAYGVLREHTAAEMERTVLMPRLHTLTERLGKVLEKGDGDHARLARRHVAVIAALLDDSMPADGTAAAEVERVRKAEGIQMSDMWGVRLDYGQFRPRGRYEGDAAMERYFRAMRYAAGVPLLLRPSRATGVSAERADLNARTALHLAHAVMDTPVVRAAYAAFDGPLTWEYGEADDLTPGALLEIEAAIAQPGGRSDKGGWTIAAAIADRALLPRIVDVVLETDRLGEGETPYSASTAWRLLPARATAESAAFQRLVEQKIGAYTGQCATLPLTVSTARGQKTKGYPSLYETLALLGDMPATSWMRQTCMTDFAAYADAQGKAGDALTRGSGLNAAQWRFTQRVLGGGESATARSNVLLGFWTWQRHAGVLYAKQSSTPRPKSFSLEKARSGASIAPSPAFFDGLRALAIEHARYGAQNTWTGFAQVLDRLSALALRTRLGQPLGADDDAYLNDIDRTLLALTGGTRDQPIVIDVHTNGEDGQALYEALGRPRVVTRGVARGGLFSHYEFRDSLQQRLTDSEWRSRIDAGKVATQPGYSAEPPRFVPMGAGGNDAPNP